MRKTLLILSIALMAHCASAQQDTQFSQYMFTPLYVNPATAGTFGVARFNLIHRSQWQGYTATFDDGGAPTSQVFSFNMPLYGISSGLGLYILNDKIGPLTNRELQANYAYHLKLSPDATLSLGVKGGLHNKTLDASRLRPRDAADPLIPTGSVNDSQIDLGIGAYYYTSSYYIGLSANHLNAAKYDFNQPRATNPLKTHVYLTGGLSYYLTDDIEVSPSVFLKSDLTQTSLDGNVRLTYADKHWVGGGFRPGEGAIAMLGTSFGSMRVGAAFDFVLFGATAKSNNSLEVFLSYDLPVPKPTKRTPIRTPRYRF